MATYQRKQTTIDLIGGILCHICKLTIANKKDFDIHYGAHKTEAEATTYTCVVCHKPFLEYPSFRGHCYLNHVIKDKFTCQHCSKRFSKACILNQHINSVHLFTCGKCNQKFTTKKELSLHEIMHKIEKDKPPYTCLSCSEIIENSGSCEMHIDESSTTVYPCSICTEAFPNASEAVNHLSAHFGNQPSERGPEIISNAPAEDTCIDVCGILCCYCDDLFRTKSEFDIHFEDEHCEQELLYSCNICGKRCQKYECFRDHCYRHQAKNRFECDDCGKLFSVLSLLVIHTEAYHAGEAVEKPFVCKTCKHAFKSQNRLINHRRVVHSLFAIDCAECGQLFESAREMMLHQRVHKNTAQKWCRHCGLHFTTLSSCEKHVEVHRVKTYMCPICNRKYKEKYILLKHINIHFEATLHFCTICNKTYNRKSRLQQHMKNHTDPRSHKCTYCGKGFLKVTDLQQHTNIHTGLKPYKCENCPKQFASYPNWSKHSLKMHNVVVKKQSNNNNIKVKSTKQNIQTLVIPTVAVMPEQQSVGEFDESTGESIDSGNILEVTQQPCNSYTEQNSEAIFDIGDILPANTATLVTDSLDSIEPTIQNSYFPPEYGPDFVNRSVETSSINGDFIDLDDHIMPHIDPLLTIKNDHPQAADPIYEGNGLEGWEPSITRYYTMYPSYEDITELSPLAYL